MKSVEWFRRETWTDEDKEEFHRKLARSREYKQAQYLRIQAYHLQHVGTPDLLVAALELLDEMLANYPAPSELSTAYQQRAQCLAKLGRFEEAIEAYRQALATQRSVRSIRTDAYLDFGELALSLGRKELYPEALHCLDEFGGSEAFPISKFRNAVIRAFIAEEWGALSEAKRQAEAALAAAAKTESPFRWHRKLGLVESLDTDVQARLERLVS